MDKHKKKDTGFFDDLSDMTKSAFSAAASMKRDLVHFVRTNVESMVKKMNFVQRDEFNEIKKNTIQNKKDLEKILSSKGGATAGHTKKPAAKTAPVAKAVAKPAAKAKPVAKAAQNKGAKANPVAKKTAAKKK